MEYLDQMTGDRFSLLVGIDRAIVLKNSEELPQYALNYKRPPTDREQAEYLESLARNLRNPT